MTKLILLGGFLGSGKTTLMVEMAKVLEQKGFKTSIITNDQGNTLVDTVYSEMAGLDAKEVAGGCFCCRFPDFLKTVKAIQSEKNPDFILAEAVGSCTDLAATVINPLITFHKDILEVLGFLTLADGERLNGEYRGMNLHNPVEPGEVLISHQLLEAEVLVMSKSDLLTGPGIDDARSFLSGINARAEVFCCSSRTGEGLSSLIDRVLEGFPLDFSERIPIDYSVYAEAEAAYGWYNGSWFLECDDKLSAAEMSFSIMESFGNPELGSVAHAKLFIQTPEGGIKVSYVMGRIQADEITLESETYGQMKIYLNIRAACSPEVLENHVENLHLRIKEQGNTIRDYEWNALVPSPPEPYYA